jgi:hypothetical protein
MGIVLAIVQSTTLGLGLLGGIALLVATYRRPRVALVVWLLTFAFVPTWIGVSVGTFLPAVSVVGVIVLIVTLGSRGWALRRADLIIVVMIVFGFLASNFYTSSLPAWIAMITQWLVCYLAAKTVITETGVAFAGKALVAVLAVVAALAIVEFIFHWHPFVNLGPDTADHQLWGPIQQRGGVDRSEWAFGHSIALSGALAIAIPFVLGSSMSGLRKAGLTVLLAAATAVTFSRGGLGAVAVGIFLSLMFERNLRVKQKIGLTFLLAVGAAIALPLVGRVFENAGTEATYSSAYRGRLLDLVPTMHAIGRSSAAVVGGDGTITYNGFASIDSTFIQLGLGFGWIVAAASLVPFIVLAVRVLMGRATTADIALISQLPLVATVAMITQWQSLLWLVGGMAVVAAQQRRKTPQSPEGDQGVDDPHTVTMRLREPAARAAR